MAQMNRNVNIEEIDSDALFGIDALKNQSFLQKVIFWGCVIIGVLLNVCLPIFTGAPTILCVLIFMVFLFAGVAFGCNYTEDMTYGKYLYCFFFKPSKHLLFESTEDVKQARKKAAELLREEEAKIRAQSNADPKEQKKLLTKLIVFAVIMVTVIAAAFIYAGTKDEEGMKHHVVELRKGA